MLRKFRQWFLSLQQRPERLLALGFLALILLGTALLAMPFSGREGRPIASSQSR